MIDTITIPSFVAPQYVFSYDPEQALAIIKGVSFIRLCGYDGCDCGHAEICGIQITVSCRKSGRTVSVDCERISDQNLLRPLAAEVLDQMIRKYDDPEQAEKVRGWFTLMVNGNAVTKPPFVAVLSESIAA